MHQTGIAKALSSEVEEKVPGHLSLGHPSRTLHQLAEQRIGGIVAPLDLLRRAIAAATRDWYKPVVAKLR